MIAKDKSTRIGLIVTMSQDETWPDSIVNRVKNYLPAVREAVSGLGAQVCDCGEIARTAQAMTAQGESLRRERIHALVIYVGTWTYSNTAVMASIKADVPVIVWANANVETFGIVGGAIVRGALEEVGIRNFMLYGDYKDPRTLAKLKTLCHGIAGATKLRGMTYGEGGGRCMGMLTARIDPSEWMSRFGIDVDNFDQVDVMRRAKLVPEEAARKLLDWMRKEFGGIEVKDDVMLAQARMYLALRELIEEKHYDFIAVKCLPEMPSCYTTFCVAHALLNDSSDDGFGQRQSFVAACEADANGALTMQILNNITGGTTMFTDVLYYDYADNMVRMCNCGSQPTDFAASRKDVTWVSEGLREFDWIMGGACPRYVGKPGRVTIARLSRVKGEYVMLISGGEALKMPLEKIKETNSQQPHVFVRLDCPPDRFVESLRSNHIHVVYGDCRDELLVTCDVLGIRPVVP
ncbi:MAG: L-fucose/L-arabinose isomerase family protein [Kiritimatiellae bacterium]|nr:L-fucose/L-arabinose isomerase family protein [Kiritimatiellia bacterium]